MFLFRGLWIKRVALNQELEDLWLGTRFLSSPNSVALTLANKPGLVNTCGLKCSTCVDFLTSVMIVASAVLQLPAIIKGCQVSPKGGGTVQSLLTNIVGELTSEPSQHSEHIGMQDKIQHLKLQIHRLDQKINIKGKRIPGARKDEQTK